MIIVGCVLGFTVATLVYGEAETPWLLGIPAVLMVVSLLGHLARGSQ